LKERFGATKVVVFGSLAYRAWFTPWSDVDLAVWGIPAGSYYRSIGSVQGLGVEAGFRIDVINPK
jgi:uncharacterized protein